MITLEIAESFNKLNELSKQKKEIKIKLLGGESGFQKELIRLETEMKKTDKRLHQLFREFIFESLAHF